MSDAQYDALVQATQARLEGAATSDEEASTDEVVADEARESEGTPEEAQAAEEQQAGSEDTPAEGQAKADEAPSDTKEEEDPLGFNNVPEELKPHLELHHKNMLKGMNKAMAEAAEERKKYESLGKVVDPQVGHVLQQVLRDQYGMNVKEPLDVVIGAVNFMTALHTDADFARQIRDGINTVLGDAPTGTQSADEESDVDLDLPPELEQKLRKLDELEAWIQQQRQAQETLAQQQQQEQQLAQWAEEVAPIRENPAFKDLDENDWDRVFAEGIRNGGDFLTAAEQIRSRYEAIRKQAEAATQERLKALAATPPTGSGNGSVPAPAPVQFKSEADRDRALVEKAANLLANG